MMYHYVRDPGDHAESGSGIPGLPVTCFEAQLDDLLRHYQVIAWPELRDCLLGQSALPPNACLLTFDDGVRDHYLNVTPALRARGLSGLFFAMARLPGEGLVLGHKIHCLLARLGPQGLQEAVWLRLTPGQRDVYSRAEDRYGRSGASGFDSPNAGLLKSILQRELSSDAEGILSRLFAEHIGSEGKTAAEFYLTQDQIAQMAAEGMHFGGHSRSHPWFDWVDAACQAEEIEASTEWLREFEPAPWAFAYPYGGCSLESPGLLRARGFAAAFTTVEQVNHADTFFIGRVDGELPQLRQ